MCECDGMAKGHGCVCVCVPVASSKDEVPRHDRGVRPRPGVCAILGV